jgi:phosphocarrier protein
MIGELIMVSQKITVLNKSVLHLRPAGLLSKIAATCKSNISLVKGEKRVNPKSVLILMSGGIKCGDEIVVECDGDSEEEDLRTIIDAINSGLGE